VVERVVDAERLESFRRALDGSYDADLAADFIGSPTRWTFPGR
jgi:hypothetical protein